LQAHGKNVYYVFSDAGSDAVRCQRSAIKPCICPLTRPFQVVVHVHFGMSGRFSTHGYPGPPSTPTTRLRLEHAESKTSALLSAMICVHGDLAFMATSRARLGPDPLREDADGEALWAKLQVSKKPVGLLLMDQAYVAGIGNIYRAEILFKAGVHPETPANLVTRPEFEALWRHSVDLLQRGFAGGSIITVDPAEGLPPPWTRRYVYNQSGCGRCRGPVRSWDMATRTLYVCETCQPRRGELATGRAAAMAKAAGAKLFTSHCTDTDSLTGKTHPPPEAAPVAMTVPQLKAALAARGLGVSGTKPILLARLQMALAPPPATAAVPVPAAAPVRTGTAHLVMASAAEAAAEKVAAGEGANVEHIALIDDAAAAVTAKGKRSAKALDESARVEGRVPFPSKRAARR